MCGPTVPIIDHREGFQRRRTCRRLDEGRNRAASDIGFGLDSTVDRRQTMIGLFGAGTPAVPAVAFVTPMDGGMAHAGGRVEATVTADAAITPHGKRPMYT